MTWYDLAINVDYGWQGNNFYGYVDENGNDIATDMLLGDFLRDQLKTPLVTEVYIFAIWDPNAYVVEFIFAHNEAYNESVAYTFRI